MKATGIVRRMDTLGRIVLPKEIRRTLRIRDGDPLEIFVDSDGEVILKKYSPIAELDEFATEYADSLNEVVGHIALVADRDVVIAVAGAPKKEFLNKAVGALTKRCMENREVYVGPRPGEQPEGALVGESNEETRFTSMVVAPIISEGDPIGAVILCTKDLSVQMTDLERKLAETAAKFLGKQMEQ